MNKRVFLWVALVAVVGVVAVLLWLPASRNSLLGFFGKEPSYKGKLASQWIEALKSPDKKVSEKAKSQLNFIGLDEEDPLPVVRLALRNPDEGVRMKACEILSGLGEQGSAALPELIDMFKNKKEVEKVRVQALASFKFMGPEKKKAVGTLTDLLKEESPKVRAEAAINLRDIGEDAKGSVPALVELVRDSEKRMAAATTEPAKELEKRALQAASYAVWDLDKEIAEKANLVKPPRPARFRAGG